MLLQLRSDNTVFIVLIHYLLFFTLHTNALPLKARQDATGQTKSITTTQTTNTCVTARLGGISLWHN